jgi:hypothetical protein
VVVEDLHVAGVRRGAVEDERRDEAAPHRLAEHPVLPVGEPRADLVVRHEEVPEPLGLRALADLGELRRICDRGVDRHLVVELVQQLQLARVDVLLDERIDTASKLLYAC